jgi:hypothetical protein
MARESAGSVSSANYYLFREKTEDYKGKKTDINITLPGDELSGYFQEIKTHTFDDGSTKTSIWLTGEDKKTGMCLEAPANLLGKINWMLDKDMIQTGTRLWITYKGKTNPKYPRNHIFDADFDKEDVFVFVRPEDLSVQAEPAAPITSSEIPF